MYWFCPECVEWGTAETDVDAVLDHRRHMSTHEKPALETTEPQQESVDESEDTVLGANYLAWGITALLGLLSAHWHALAGVVPFAAVLAWVMTQSSD